MIQPISRKRAASWMARAEAILGFDSPAITMLFARLLILILDPLANDYEDDL